MRHVFPSLHWQVGKLAQKSGACRCFWSPPPLPDTISRTHGICAGWRVRATTLPDKQSAAGDANVRPSRAQHLKCHMPPWWPPGTPLSTCLSMELSIWGTGLKTPRTCHGLPDTSEHKVRRFEQDEKNSWRPPHKASCVLLFGENFSPAEMGIYKF